MPDQIELTTRATIKPATSFDTERLLALARERAPDPTAIDGRTPFFMRAQISSNELDFYYSIMMPPTLEQFSSRLNEGISLLENHNIFSNANAQSLEGVVNTFDDTIELHGDKRMTVDGTFWSVRDLEVNGKSTNGWIDAVRLGLWKDVSVGFHATDIRCSICGEQIYSGFLSFDGEGCTHLPGLKYKQEGGTKEVLCWAAIMDGDLHETSNVYDGATPNAVVQKAELLGEAGEISEGARAVLAQHYGTRAVERVKAAPRRFTRGAPAQRSSTVTRISRFDDRAAVLAVRVLTATDTDAVVATTDDGTEITAGALVELANELESERFNDTDDAELDEIEQELASVDVQVETDANADERTKRLARVRAITGTLQVQRQTITQLEKDAEDGRAWRKSLIDETVAEGIRARGDKFNEAHVRSLLEHASIDHITYMRDDYRAIADAALPNQRLTGGGGGDDTRTPGDDQQQIVNLDTSASRVR